MPSPFGLLLRTMPFTGALNALMLQKNKSFAELSGAEVRERITLLPEDAAFHFVMPALNPALEPEAQPIWAFGYTTSRPAEVGEVYCRVRDADYVGHHVAERIAWGLEAGAEPFKPEVRVKLKAGADLRLPLTKEYLLWSFWVKGGYISEDQTRLWRLESLLDGSVVAAFAFDVDPATGQITKTDFDKVHDPTLRDDLQRMSRAVKELLGGGWPGATPEGQGGAEGAGPGETPPPPPPDVETATPSGGPGGGGEEEDEPELSTNGAGPLEGSTEDAQPWAPRVLGGDLFSEAENAPPVGGAPVPGGLSGEVGDAVDVATEPARFLIVFSFTTCRERADYEPGGVVGFARCYPHLLAAATVPVQTIEASAHIDRPAKLSKWSETGREMSASCCKPPYDGWTPEIGGLLVTDVNKIPNPLLPIPFWSNMFFYYLVDPFFAGGQKKYHVIRTDRPDSRNSVKPLVQRRLAGPVNPEGGRLGSLAFVPNYDGIVEKEPRQGAFDNVHLAPRLRLMNVVRITDVVVDERLMPEKIEHISYPVEDRAAWRFDDIAMAPFCAHDCLHMHFRWAKFASAKWSLGWNANGPYAVAGAPQVPEEQDVWLWFRARAAITYHVVASSPRLVDGWHVFMHHGFGYALSIQGVISHLLAMTAMHTFSGVVFLGTEGQSVHPSASTAAYYWQARYGFEVTDGKAAPFERLSVESRENLEEAMDL
jgi:hypothetical protein